jgi:hypothetical protein
MARAKFAVQLPAMNLASDGVRVLLDCGGANNLGTQIVHQVSSVI